MEITRTYFRPTTAQQRRLLFETWETTGHVQCACTKAHVCQGTFYYWKPRFEAGGYAALEQPKSHAPKSPRKTSEDVERHVRDLRIRHPRWGKQRMADELAKQNNWRPVMSSNTVKRILDEAGLWKPSRPEAGNTSVQPVVRTADRPGQSVNVAVCFIPVTHEGEQKLPAVSGSSGHVSLRSFLRRIVRRNANGRAGSLKTKSVSMLKSCTTLSAHPPLSQAQRLSLRIASRPRNEHCAGMNGSYGMNDEWFEHNGRTKMLSGNNSKPRGDSNERTVIRTLLRNAKEKTSNGIPYGANVDRHRRNENTKMNAGGRHVGIFGSDGRSCPSSPHGLRF